MPHDARCGCDECVQSSQSDSLRHSQARINAYRALTSSSLIALRFDPISNLIILEFKSDLFICFSSPDPILTAFELSWELRRLSRMETEFRTEYNVTIWTNFHMHFTNSWFWNVRHSLTLGNASIGSRVCKIIAWPFAHIARIGNHAQLQFVTGTGRLGAGWPSITRPIEIGHQL